MNLRISAAFGMALRIGQLVGTLIFGKIPCVICMKHAASVAALCDTTRNKSGDPVESEISTAEDGGSKCSVVCTSMVQFPSHERQRGVQVCDVVLPTSYQIIM